ncbi:MAG: indole-3-glycerol phosphate synthase TrpC [Chloroflexi bacterium]|nr:indole-3-glycerol phosphate synthase TrpC [Chloroflexota bacterium]MQC25794.1 indole-3-glycerol phosphate synthase TrpC [Chloroflexota bacterium]MQC48432.1 indole-3-glycerol phosphate synthase TrpC [Chloroflexota bacterium]
MTARETGTVLDRIVADRRVRLAEDRRVRDESALRARIDASTPPLSFVQRLREGRVASPPSRVRLIAEIKRGSPSKGMFDADLDAVAQARSYASAGAAAISILTEPDHFHGSIKDLEDVAGAFAGDQDRPALLRKDFIFDPYQVLEARAFGADALLLIVMMLEPSALRDLLAQTRALGMEAVVEVHDEVELAAAVEARAVIIGVNNRDLRTFAEDLGTFERLAALAPESVTLVAESAIRAPEDARRMADAGAHALLVGEALVRSGTVEETARSLMLLETVGR